MSQPLTPLADRVIATRAKPLQEQPAGCIYRSSAKVIVAVVEAAGPEVKSLKKGDRIVYKEYSTTD